VGSKLDGPAEFPDDGARQATRIGLVEWTEVDPLVVSNRRGFFAGAAAAFFARDAVTRVARAGQIAEGRQGDGIAGLEDYWSEIRRAFDADRTLINLNHGGVSSAPSAVLESMIRDLRFANVAPSYHMWDVLEPRIESVRRELAREFGCDPAELAVTRNASEAMQILIAGIDLRRGDEVVISDQNYGRMQTAWDQRARRDGVVVKKVSFGGPNPSPDEVVARFRSAMTPRTRVVEVTHVVNLTGNILPVREVAAMAREQGAETFVDGAHAFAHFPFRRDDLGCDYYATSLHKWLLAPVGTGFLYVRKASIPKIWPLMAANVSMNEDVRKFEEIGTHPAANHNAIAAALSFHRAIGADRKAARLRYLRNRWASKLADATPRARLISPSEEERSCGIGLLHVDGIDPAVLKQRLWDKHRIITVAIKHAEFSGLRVTPNVDIAVEEVDLFADAVLEAIRAIG
jgi:selenocysteine lyase/cysteine desulfurase